MAVVIGWFFLLLWLLSCMKRLACYILSTCSNLSFECTLTLNVRHLKQVIEKCLHLRNHWTFAIFLFFSYADHLLAHAWDKAIWALPLQVKITSKTKNWADRCGYPLTSILAWNFSAVNADHYVCDAHWGSSCSWCRIARWLQLCQLNWTERSEVRLDRS
jgi:hypothetical protein